jgi:hypothetical protein
MKISIIAFMLCCVLSLPSFSEDGQKDPSYLHFLTFGIGDSNKYLKNLTIKIVLGEDFDVRIDDGIEYIAGRIERRDGKLYAHLRNHYVTMYCNYDGIIEAEKKYLTGSCSFSGVGFSSYFVVSANADSKPFLSTKPEPSDPQKQGNILSK